LIKYDPRDVSRIFIQHPVSGHFIEARARNLGFPAISLREAWAATSAAKTTLRLPSRPTRMSGISGGGAVSPAFRLTRSVDRVGRKTEMTRGIARLQFEICALAGAAADQLHEPARAADTRDRERRRR
jgi:hypothetical protein